MHRDAQALGMRLDEVGPGRARMSMAVREDMLNGHRTCHGGYIFMLVEPIERASRDELQALQLERLRWSLRHAYDKAPHYRASFDAAGVHPDDLGTLGARGSRSAVSRPAAPDQHPRWRDDARKPSLLPPQGIERSMTGKARRVVDKRPKP